MADESTDAEKQDPMKPVVIIPPKTMSPEDIQRMRDTGLCVVECTKPHMVRFLDPPPCSVAVRDRAAIETFKMIWSRRVEYPFTRDGLAKVFVGVLMGDDQAKIPSAPKAVPSATKKKAVVGK